MRRALFYTIFTLCALLPLGGRAQSVVFYDGTVYEALAEAQRQEKMLIVEFYAEWSHRSRWMHDVIARSEELSKWFVVSQADTQSEEGAGLAQMYGVTDYPTLVVFNSQGDALDKLTKTMELVDFENYIREIRLTNSAAVSMALLRTILYEATQYTPEKEQHLQQLAQEYLSEQDTALLLSQSHWEMFTSDIITHYATPAYKFMAENVQQFHDLDLAQNRLQKLYYDAIMPYFGHKGVDTLFVEVIRLDSVSLQAVPAAQELCQLVEYRQQKNADAYLELLSEVLVDVPQTIEYQLLLSVDFIAEIAADDKNLRRRVYSLLKDYMEKTVSPSKNAMIEAILEKFS